MAKERVRIEKAKNGQWMFHVYGANGEHQGTGETYTRKHDSERGQDAAFLSFIAHYKEKGRLTEMLEKAEAVPDVAPKRQAYAEALGENSGVWFVNGDGSETFVTWNEVAEFVGTRPPHRVMPEPEVPGGND